MMHVRALSLSYQEILKSQHPSVFTTESHYEKYFFFKELVP
jgi:hypothetical protein